jgi:hypothetical protein
MAHGSGKDASVASSFTITILNVPPSQPVDSDASANEVREGAEVGTPVGITAFSTDPNGPSVTYSLSNSAGGRFAINLTTSVASQAASLDGFAKPCCHVDGLGVLNAHDPGRGYVPVHMGSVGRVLLHHRYGNLCRPRH